MDEHECENTLVPRPLCMCVEGPLSLLVNCANMTFFFSQDAAAEPWHQSVKYIPSHSSLSANPVQIPVTHHRTSFHTANAIRRRCMPPIARITKWGLLIHCHNTMPTVPSATPLSPCLRLPHFLYLLSVSSSPPLTKINNSLKQLYFFVLLNVQLLGCMMYWKMSR